jgi:hypothetical protein
MNEAFYTMLTVVLSVLIIAVAYVISLFKKELSGQEVVHQSYTLVDDPAFKEMKKRMLVQQNEINKCLEDIRKISIDTVSDVDLLKKDIEILKSKVSAITLRLGIK